jgi:hypothetical protein
VLSVKEIFIWDWPVSAYGNMYVCIFQRKMVDEKASQICPYIKPKPNVALTYSFLFASYKNELRRSSKFERSLT